MQIDATKLMWSAFYLHWMWSAPLQLTICSYLLYEQLGPAAFVSLGIMIAMGPVNVFVMKVAVRYQRQTMERRDKRVKTLTELLQVNIAVG
jgi:ATP-binding cassette subfamily C (CFTR/MRP) protein 4